jgi:hypothetical protein
MRKIILSALLLAVVNFSFAQNAYINYKGEINETSQTNFRIFDKTLVWIYKSIFKKNMEQLKMYNGNVGIVVGRTLYYSAKKGIVNPDTNEEPEYADYNFEWIIEIDNSHINFTLTNTKNYNDINRTNTIVSKKIIPVNEFAKNDNRIGSEWETSQSYSIKKLDTLVAALCTELETGEDDLVWFSVDKTYILPSNESQGKSTISKK